MKISKKIFENLKSKRKTLFLEECDELWKTIMHPGSKFTFQEISEEIYKIWEKHSDKEFFNSCIKIHSCSFDNWDYDNELYQLLDSNGKETTSISANFSLEEGSVNRIYREGISISGGIAGYKQVIFLVEGNPYYASNDMDSVYSRLTNSKRKQIKITPENLKDACLDSDSFVSDSYSTNEILLEGWYLYGVVLTDNLIKNNFFMEIILKMDFSIFYLLEENQDQRTIREISKFDILERMQIQPEESTEQDDEFA
jgi:hypothetical protein